MHPYTDPAGQLTPAGWQLVLDHDALARKVARSYARPPRDYHGAYAAAQDRLIDAARTFDPDRGVKFLTYVYLPVHQAVWKWLAREMRGDTADIAALPTGLADELTGSEPAADEVAARREELAIAAAVAAEADAATADLSPRMRQIWTMWRLSGSRREVARTLGVSPQWVSEAIRRMIAWQRERFQVSDPTPKP
jgi:RNA polymerase sigma factor (sigma-70 family)